MEVPEQIIAATISETQQVNTRASIKKAISKSASIANPISVASIRNFFSFLLPIV
jgi:hypothetical protein